MLRQHVDMKINMKNAGQVGVLDEVARRLAGQRHEIRHVEAILLRAKIDVPVQTSFGTMYDRPALLVRITDADGCVGHGEIWCNFPSRGAEYKAGLLVNEFAYWLKGRHFSSPAEIFDGLTAAFAVLGLQTADPGTLLQVIAGVDQALWDMVARRQGMRLCALFGAPGDAVRAYASGIHPKEARERVQLARERGFTAFKVKVGFGEDVDRDGLAVARQLIDDDHQLMIDANQAWMSPQQAADNINALSRFDLKWIEEPLRASAAPAQWQELANMISVPLAGGENLPTLDAVDAYQAQALFAFVQPDIGKIGGFTGLLRIFGGRDAVQPPSKSVYCPHWLGGMVGLAASAHLLTVIGDAGLLEVDVNDNPIRESLADWDLRPSNGGRIELPEDDGIGIVPDLPAMKEHGVQVTIMPG
ncbi:MAG: mandelate racemase/muconate lactonizing enzyme family protein [Rhodobiaceae bacterium]